MSVIDLSDDEDDLIPAKVALPRPKQSEPARPSKPTVAATSTQGTKRRAGAGRYKPKVATLDDYDAVDQDGSLSPEAFFADSRKKKRRKDPVSAEGILPMPSSRSGPVPGSSFGSGSGAAPRESMPEAYSVSSDSDDDEISEQELQRALQSDPRTRALLEAKRQSTRHLEQLQKARVNPDSVVLPQMQAVANQAQAQSSESGPVPGSQGAGAGPARTALTLVMVATENKWNKKFKVFSDTPFSQMAEYVKQSEKLAGVRFIVDGEVVDPGCTPGQLELEDEDQVDVIFEQLPV